MPIPVTIQMDIGTRNPQVKLLQQWLNQNGFPVAFSGQGSPGQETDYFGPLTEAAVRKFQIANDIVGSGTPSETGFGRVGPQTLSKLSDVWTKGGDTGGDTGGSQNTGGVTITGLGNFKDPFKTGKTFFSGLSPDRIRAEVERNPTSAFRDNDRAIQAYSQTRKLADLNTIFSELKQDELGFRSRGIDPMTVPQFVSRLRALSSLSDPTDAAFLRPGEGDAKTVGSVSSLAANFGFSFNGTGGAGTGGETGSGGVDEGGEPELRAFTEFDAYKNLSSEDREFIDEIFSLIQIGGEEEAKRFADAIEQAKGVADPFFKVKLNLALAEVSGRIAESTQDFATKKEILERARDQILEDVGLARDFFTLEQEAEISRITRSFDQDILRIGDAAAAKGLTFTTGAGSRQQAESRRTEEFTDVFQSSTRLGNLRLKELELRASRGETNAQKELEALRSGQTLQLQNIGRRAEEVLGTGNLPDIQGFSPVGEALGTIEEQKRRTIISDVGGFLDLQKEVLR